MKVNTARVYLLALVVCVAGLGWPSISAANPFYGYIPRPYSQQRAEQRILHIEGMGGSFALDGADGGVDLALASGARVRLTQGYTQLWAVEVVALGGRGRLFCVTNVRTRGTCDEPMRKMDFVRLAFGGVFRFGDKRIPHIRGNLGVQWMRHLSQGGAEGERTQSDSAVNEFSLIPTLGVGYDRRFGQNVLIGATLSLAWIGMSNLRERGFHSVDAGVRFGIGW